MSRLIITTVGTSLLTNRGWKWGSPLPDAKALETYLDSVSAADASAETNTLHRLELDESDWLEFLHSDTDEGRFCANQLCQYYQGQCRDVRLREIKSLNYHHQSFAQAGLKRLVQIVFESLNTPRPGSPVPVFAATGGFKAEIAFLNLVGALLKIEVYYIHDQFRELVRLPRLPLTWDTNYVLENQDFFEWIDEEPRSSLAVESWLKSRPELRPLVDEDRDGHTYLNAAGDLLYRAAKNLSNTRPQADWPPGDPRPPQEKNGLSGMAHYRPPGWESFVNRLCAIDCVTRVAYDPIAYGGSPVKIIPGSYGEIAVRFGSAEKALPLRVSTTSRSEAQTELIREYLSRLL